MLLEITAWVDWQGWALPLDVEVRRQSVCIGILCFYFSFQKLDKDKVKED